MEKQFPINLGIKPEINTIYEGHQEVLKSYRVAFPWASSLDYLQNTTHYRFPALDTILMCQQKGGDNSHNCFMTTTVDEFLMDLAGQFLAHCSKFMISLIKPWKHLR